MRRAAVAIGVIGLLAADVEAARYHQETTQLRQERQSQTIRKQRAKSGWKLRSTTLRLPVERGRDSVPKVSVRIGKRTIAFPELGFRLTVNKQGIKVKGLRKGTLWTVDWRGDATRQLAAEGQVMAALKALNGAKDSVLWRAIGSNPSAKLEDRMIRNLLTVVKAGVYPEIKKAHDTAQAAGERHYVNGTLIGATMGKSKSMSEAKEAHKQLVSDMQKTQGQILFSR